MEAARLVSGKVPCSPVPHTTVAPREAGGDLKSLEVSVTTGEPSGQGCPMVGCGRRVTDLKGHCLGDHVPEVFRDLSLTGEDFGVCVADYPEGAWGIRGTYLGMSGGCWAP